MNNGTYLSFSYRDIVYGLDGWVDASKYLPRDFDLVTLKIKGSANKPGWSIGNAWEGATVDKLDIITHWKRRSDERENM